MFRAFSKSKNDRPESGGVAPRRVSETKSDLAIMAPKGIVRALYPYAAQQQDELSFEKNAFFYVNDDSNGEWYMAFDPLRNIKGLVPQSYFEVIQKQDQQQAMALNQAQRAHSRSGSTVTPTEIGGPIGGVRNGGASSSGPEIISRSTQSKHKQSGSQSSQSSGNRSSLAIYGLVLYDFQAERNDELTVTAGESIVIVARSTEEWFVAKPIGRLGGPGLIPVSYVELREVGTDRKLEDINDATRRANLPRVEEWKRRLAEYKASSIPLGRFGTASDKVDHSQSSATSMGSKNHSRSISAAHSARSDHSWRSARSRKSRESYQMPQTALAGMNINNNSTNGHQAQHSSDPYVIIASVDRFAVNGGRYWYLVKVELSNGKHRNLCRFYQDFYDFQIKLLEQFPDEAGRTGKTRTLPFMPGPLTLVTHTVSSQRRANLDDYVRDLIRMPPHVSQSSIVTELFSIRPGDIESDEVTQQLPEPPQSDDDQQYSGDMPEYQLNEAVESYKQPSTKQAESVKVPYSEDERNSHDFVQEREWEQSYSQQQHTQQQQSESQYSKQNSSAQPFPQSQPVYGTPYGDHAVPARSDIKLEQSYLKIKIFVGANVVAVRAPLELQFLEIYDKISARLSTPNPQLFLNPELRGDPIDNAGAFARALNGGNKINLYLKQ